MNNHEMIAKALDDALMNDIEQYEQLPDHVFSRKFKRKMKKLMKNPYPPASQSQILCKREIVQ